MKTISRYIMTLALLITAATGAWATDVITITQGFEDGMGDWTMNHCEGNTGIKSGFAYEGSNCFRFYYTTNYPQYLISPELDENDGGTMSFYYARESSNYIESFKVGYSTTTSEPSAFTWGNQQTVSNGDGGDFFNYTYNFPAGTKYVSIACTSPDQFYLFIDNIRIEYVAAADPNAVEVTTNAAEEGATFTEASFQMPASDVTAEYELVRDMSIQMTAQVGDGTQEQPRYRVKKDGNNKFIPADMEMAAVPALFTVNDAIEQKALTQTQDYIVQIYAIDAEGQPTGEAMTFATFTFEPGIYAVKAVAAQGSDYDGETALSNTFKLFQGYEVEVAAKEFITYYKDEPLYVEDEAAELYTISSVNGDQAVLSDRSDAMPSNTPMLVYNKSNETKVILLIPCAEPDMAITVAPEFQGTLTGTTIAASTENETNYAFNGKQFVFVKNAIEVGPNKAWLSINTGEPSARAITLVFDEETTGLNEERRMKSEEFATATWYDLNGRKLDKMPTKKGVYLFNGRKVVVVK